MSVCFLPMCIKTGQMLVDKGCQQMHATGVDADILKGEARRITACKACVKILGHTHFFVTMPTKTEEIESKGKQKDIFWCIFVVNFVIGPTV